jgi:hypothetical protein
MLKNARSQWRRTPVLARSLGTLLLYLLQLCPLRGMPLASFLHDSALYRNKEWPGLVALLSLSLSLSLSLFLSLFPNGHQEPSLEARESTTWH